MDVICRRGRRTQRRVKSEIQLGLNGRMWNLMAAARDNYLSGRLRSCVGGVCRQVTSQSDALVSQHCILRM